MFGDQLLPNVLSFVAGISVAIYWLRTGMVHRGAVLLGTMLLAADAVLLCGIVLAPVPVGFVVSLSILQLSAAAGAAVLLQQLLRRMLSRCIGQRRRLFDEAWRSYLRNDLATARAIFDRLRRADPWHAPSLLALASVLARQGQGRKARRLLRAARRLDRSGAYADLVALRLQRPDPRPQATEITPSR